VGFQYQWLSDGFFYVEKREQRELQTRHKDKEELKAKFRYGFVFGRGITAANAEKVLGLTENKVA